MTKQDVSQVIGGLVIVHIAAALYVAYWLRAKHEEVWESLGRPSFLNWSMLSSFRLSVFVFLSGAHRKLNDNRPTYIIYGERILFIVIMGMIIWWKLNYF
jgi:hypothetical protein